MSILLAILLFGILIFVHELGHFVFAKLFGVRVLKFSLGFGPRLFGIKKGETEYIVSALPLGGYVKMLGEDPDDTISSADRDRSFKNQPIRKKAIIVLAGPLFNVLLTFFLYTTLLAAGIELPVPDLKNLMPVIDEVIADQPASRAGLQKDDRIVSIGDTEINTWLDIIGVVATNPDKPLQFGIRRGDEFFKITITPRAEQITDRDGKIITIGRIGIKRSGSGIYTFVKSSSLPDAPVQGAIATYKMGRVIYDSMWMTATGEISVKNVGGPITIITESNKAAAAGMTSYLLFMALISVNLGILNLLPIPVLDGGHLLIMGIEAVRGKPLKESAVAVVHKIGLALLLALMIFVMYNDIFRLFSGKPMP
jgi:regulator of sigma E protease